jgi:hypothetical protein
MSCTANSLGTLRKVQGLILLSVLALLIQLPARGTQSVELSWNPSTLSGVVGYKIYVGTASRVYARWM